jgi:uncharacterized protein (DUF1697 family)
MVHLLTSFLASRDRVKGAEALDNLSAVSGWKYVVDYYRKNFGPTIAAWRARANRRATRSSTCWSSRAAPERLPAMAVHVALLRGINLGPSRRVAMADLRALLAEAGYGDVRTLLQSGNVVLSGTAKPEAVAAALETLLAERFGMDIPVVVRSRAQLAAVVQHSPLGDVAKDPKKYVVTFMSGKPDASFVRSIADGDHAPEQFAAHGRELYTWHPNGIQKSKLARLVGDKRLGVTATARNWATVTKLLEMASE